MAKEALVFSGQGTQHTEMGSSLFKEFEGVRDVFHLAGSVSGVDMGQLCFARTAGRHRLNRQQKLLF